MKLLLVLSLAVVALSSCHSGGGGSNNVPARPTYEGDLLAKAQEIYGVDNESHFYDCDRTWKNRILEMSAAVEANRSNIVEIQKNSVDHDDDVKILNLNGFDFVESLTKANGVDAWTQDRYSWPLIYTYYSRFKTDLKHKAWLTINGAARSLILEDQKRVVYQLHPGARLSSKEVILSSFAKIEACQKNSACTTIDFSSTEKTWLQEGVVQSLILQQMFLNEDRVIKRKYIEFLFADVGYAANRFGFFKNAMLTTSANTLVVPLDLSVLGKDSATLIDVLEKTWAVHGLQLRIVQSSEGYKVKVSNTPGERAYVSHSEKLMQLYSPTPLTTVEHEFGHVLGLRDSYYTSFDQKTCDYVDDSNEGNIMSSSNSGKVLTEHIQKIKAAYGLQ